MAADQGVDDDHVTWQSIFFDYDHDGDADLYVSNDKGVGCTTASNRFFENQDATFVEITEATGTEACMDSMGIAVGDFDGNEHQDLYCTNVFWGNKLFLNQGDGTFVESALVTGTSSQALGWGALFFDYDNDSFMDLYVCNQSLPNRLFNHGGDWPSMDLAPALGVDSFGLSYACAAADIDLDGDLDLLVQNNNAEPLLYVNHEGSGGNWARLRVEGRRNNTDAIGARVVVRVGAKNYLREVIAGCNYKSQNELPLHFGLGQAQVMDKITVHWPGVGQRVISNMPANRSWTLHPPERLGDWQGDGRVSFDDLVAFWNCFTGPVTGMLESGCEVMDLDGDGDVDMTDHLLLRERFAAESSSGEGITPWN